MTDNYLILKKYYIRRTNKFLTRYEIYHFIKGNKLLDGYTVTRLGAKYQAKNFMLKDFIEILD